MLGKIYLQTIRAFLKERRSTGFFFWFRGDAGTDIPYTDITIIAAGD
jgi:hypothetical protein